jgi:hypothetical protein
MTAIRKVVKSGCQGLLDGGRPYKTVGISALIAWCMLACREASATMCAVADGRQSAMGEEKTIRCKSDAYEGLSKQLVDI